jgi:hypothetical protein
MSFSWWCKDKKGKDLFDEFEINGQALGLSDDHCEYSTEDLRHRWMEVGYKGKLEDAARDAVETVQTLVAANLRRYTEPPHKDECPACTCEPPKPAELWGMDIEQAKRFLAIPLDRVWRAGGGY